MRRNWWIGLALLIIFPAVMLTTSCAKKAVKPDETAAVTQTAEDDAAAKAAAEQARQEELARQKAMEEQRLAEEAARRAAQEALAAFEAQDVYFDYDKSTLRSDAQAVLQGKAAYMQANPAISVVIEGHCDERGTNEYNLALGDRRAQSVKRYLLDLGISAARMTTISYGEERPVDVAHTEEAWAKNRRAHVKVR